MRRAGTWRLMTFGFLNLLMLGGLAGVALPVVVHLISRRKYDVVSWGRCSS
ncbi:MAG: hypothetical protein R3B91_10290 [Planctomycetaceae bacterium]